MRIGILGAGAVGGYIGSKLIAAGADVTFLVRGDRLSSLNETGLVLSSPTGPVACQVIATSDPIAGPAPQLVIITCKAPALADALEAVAPSLGPQTRLLPLLNGVAHLETLRQRFPDTPLLAGIVHGALNLRGDGAIELLTPFVSTVIGGLSDSADPVARQLRSLLAAAGVDARSSSDIRQDMWNKFVFLTTLAGITCLMRADIGTILMSDDGVTLMRDLLDECSAVAAMEGFPPGEGDMKRYKDALFEKGSTFTSSMLRDIRRRRRTEADHVVGDMLRRAQRNGISTPILRLANAHLQCFEAGIYAAANEPP
jgi:2-dehydropantoate 2-reductase